MNMNSKGEQALHETMTFFNTRQDALTAIVKSKTDIKGELGDIYIVHIEDDEVEIAYHPPPQGKLVKTKIALNPPLGSSFEARGRLLNWRNAAYKKWDVPAVPKVQYFKRPDAFPYAVPAVVALLCLFFTLWAPGSAGEWARAFVARHMGRDFLKWIGYFAAGMHLVVEPMFMLILIYKHSTPLVPAIQWLLWNVAVGYGVLDQFRECIMYERMRVIYRQTDVGDIGPNIKTIEEKKEKKSQ